MKHLTPKKKTVENIEVKEEIAGNQHFLLFLHNFFLLYPKQG